MDSSIFHPHWYRIAELHPRLRGHISIRRQVVRDLVWYVLTDPVDGRHFRLNSMAYRFVGLCNGERSVQEVWEHMTETLGDEAPTQAELVEILARLSHGDLLQTEALPDVDVMFENRNVRRDKQRWSQLNPLFFRVGLLNPTPYLHHFDAWLMRLFSRGSLIVWLSFLALAGVLATMNEPGLADHVAERVTSPGFLLLTWLAYPVIKTLHELGHALAIRRWGGEVNKVGVTLLLLMPIPWVDASASSTFRFRKHRLVVSAAGIMVELFLAALALLLWLAVEPSWVRDVALAVMLIAGVSTVFFNGNPLMRYDGYFILSDAIDLPNLAPRSSNFWAYLIKRYLLRLEEDPPTLARGERSWLMLYAPASLAYRIVISGAIILWLSETSILLGAVAGIILLWTFFLNPGMALVRSVWRDIQDPRQAHRARLLTGAVAGLLAVVVLFLPLPMSIVAEGLVWLPENARVRPETDGFVVRMLVQDGAQVVPGQAILELRDADLLAERDRLSARFAQYESEQYGVLIRKTDRASNLAQEIESTQAALHLNDTRLQSLIVRAGSAGRLVLPRQEDLPGRFVPRGQEIGYILAGGTPKVRALLAQQDVSLVREHMRRATVWFNETALAYPASPSRDIPSASVHLPSPAMGDRGGGSVATDPKDDKGVTALEPVFQIELDVPGIRLLRVGARTQVRFDLGFEPLVQQTWRRLRQVFLSQFSQGS